MFQHKSFNPKVIIVDHFNDVKNQIDIRTETIFDEKSNILSENRIQFLNKLRQTFLEKIDQVKEKHLSKLATINDEKAFNLKWKHVIESGLFKYEETIESLKEDLISFDCIVISDKKCALGVTLWITPWYFNENSLGILRMFNQFSDDLDDLPYSFIKMQHDSLDKVAVKIFCLISDKQKQADDIKDFSQLDLSKIEKLTLPWVSSNSFKEHDILEIGSVDKNAFVEFTNLTCLHLHIRLKLQPHTYDKIDFEHLINLKELSLGSTLNREFDLNHAPNYLNFSPPPNLEKLTIVYFGIKLNTLTHLKNLNFLRLDKVQTLGLSDSKAFLDFASLKHLDFCSRNLVFDCINRESLHMGPESLEVLNMGDIRCNNRQQPKISFENLPNLKKLKVVVGSNLDSLKKLTSLEDLGLVLRVECSDKKKMIGLLGNFSKLKKLSVYGLSSVDRDFFKQYPNLESLHLWLESNDIQGGSFDSLTNLTVLKLTRNQFEQLDVDLFKSLTKLVSLDLSFNPLKRIPSKLFANLAELNELNLCKCELRDLEPNTFHGLDNLNKLELSSNKLTHLNEALFRGLKNLTQLDLRFNELTEIKEETFEDTRNLIKLDLSYNQLIGIRFGLNNESGLQQLKFLDLSGNNFEKFEIYLRNLEELDLNSNESLTRLRPGALKNLSSLKRLRLYNCSLKVVDVKAFEGLFSLEHLDLENNDLEDIGMGTFDLMDNLKMINIRYNGKKFYEKLVSNEKPLFCNSLREINPGCVILYEPYV